MADPTLTEKMRMGIGGKQWRCYQITHTGEATCTVTAGSLGLEYIEAIIGVNTGIPVQAAPGSTALGMTISISATRDSLVWVSTCACVQQVTIIGW
jgi:hypothetical protein